MSWQPLAARKKKDKMGEIPPPHHHFPVAYGSMHRDQGSVHKSQGQGKQPLLSPTAPSLPPNTGHSREQSSSWSRVHRATQSREGVGDEGNMGSVPVQPQPPLCCSAGWQDWPQAGPRGRRDEQDRESACFIT